MSCWIVPTVRPRNAIDRAHPFRVALGQVIVDRDDVDAQPGEGVEVGGRVATRVFPSPVFISAILPWWRTTPPISWTSKWRIPVVRREASRTTANASGRMSSRVAPWPSFSLNSAVLARRASSERAGIRGSKSLTRPTKGVSFFRSRSLFVPKSFSESHLTIFYI